MGEGEYAIVNLCKSLADEKSIDNPVRIKKIPVIEPSVNYYSNVEFKLILENVKDGFPFKQVKTIDGDKELFLKAYCITSSIKDGLPSAPSVSISIASICSS